MIPDCPINVILICSFIAENIWVKKKKSKFDAKKQVSYAVRAHP